jgi:prevent-host-death family protein
MSKDTVSVATAKAQFDDLLARVEAGEIIAITRDGVPIAELVPITHKAKRQFGAMRGLISIGPEFFEPQAPDDLDSWDR